MAAYDEMRRVRDQVGVFRDVESAMKWLAAPALHD